MAVSDSREERSPEIGPDGGNGFEHRLRKAGAVNAPAVRSWVVQNDLRAIPREKHEKSLREDLPKWVLPPFSFLSL